MESSKIGDALPAASMAYVLFETFGVAMPGNASFSRQETEFELA